MNALKPEYVRLYSLDLDHLRVLASRMYRAEEWGAANGLNLTDPQSLQRVSANVFAIAHHGSVAFCNVQIECIDRFVAAKRFFVAPDGKRMVINSSAQSEKWNEIDLETGARQPIPIGGFPLGVAYGDGAIAFADVSMVRVLDTGGVEVFKRQLDGIGSSVGWIGNTQFIYPFVKNAQVHLGFTNEAAQMSEVNALQDLPWDVRFISHAEGKLFGIAWQTYSWFHLLNPLRCIDECPPDNHAHFVLFRSQQKTRVAAIEANIGKGMLNANLGVSPSGRRALLIDRGGVRLFALNP